MLNATHHKFLSYLLFVYLLSTACNDPARTNSLKHYQEEMIQDFKKICVEEKQRDTGIFLIDSLYKTFPYISVADKYRYYDFRRELFELVRYDDYSYDTAITYLDSMIALIEGNKVEKIMMREYVNAFNKRSDYYIRRQRFELAIFDLNRCRQLNLSLGDSCLVAENTRALSLIAIKQSDFALAANLLKEALKQTNYCKNDQDQFVRTQRYLDDLGYVYSSARKHDSSLLYHFAAVKYIEENRKLYTSDTLFPYVALQNIYANMAVSYAQLENFNEAELYIKKALAILTNITKDTLEAAATQLVYAQVLYRNGKLYEAETIINKAMPLLDKFNLFFKADLLLVKAEIANGKKLYKEEAKYQKWLRLVKDTIAEERIGLLQKNPFTEYERLDKKYQVELLKKDNLNQRNKTSAVVAIVVLLSLLAIISLFFLLRLRTVMRKRSVLYKQLQTTMNEKEVTEKRLRDIELIAQEMRLQTEFNEAIVQQRRQISDDMHDELSSSLAALKFYVEDISRKYVGTGAEQSLQDIKAEVGIIYENSRKYMHGLRTGNWETQFSIIEFVHEVQQKFSEKGLMKVRLDVDAENIRAKLSTKQHDQLYHIIKEAISNIIKHAGATEFILSIRFVNEQCVFSISDNGKGFGKENAGYGIGIQSMQNRINELKGTIAFTSKAEGHSVSGSFPLNGDVLL